ncbi:pyridoxal phosphate-dependent decarboxylase family protein [Saccharopolyspora mangrovi]|uniref:Aminotransferase class V-fold PLP-dependent enzyme n=1 Tax=Saccharopolyspora mangrovi TaxID=3082379 RepID=A0ABU6AEK1_9PSEU|nr:aminotransferase class V-fold PLP-dependent enzyme [Saccharopolyspora sp. S2-29]MEB3369970.1 aminotransferase class V-fold PLP-dependent enzyme [Saccharopolyspora sp. S2-29]
MRPAEEILAELGELRAGDLPTRGGRTLAYVYDSGLDGVDDLAAAAHAQAAGANGLDPTAFPSLLRMENDLVAAASRLLGGTPRAVGSVTSGGTESCMLAVLAAREGRTEVIAPNVVLPATAHAAFHKAAHLFRVRPVILPVDPVTFRADPDTMTAAIDDDTVLVVASAPSYAHGVLDPIAEIAAGAAARGVRMHVDACIGGWVLPYFRRLGRSVPEFGFTVDGVTSVSVDLHKYAYCPKGTSVLLHADAELRRGHFFADAGWPGYTMLNSTLQSTRSGGPLAAAWAVLHHLGDDGYLALAQASLDAVEVVRAEIEDIDGLRLVVEPNSTLLAITTDGEGLDLFTLADEMGDRGWYVQPQFAHQSSPANLHLTITAANRGGEAEFGAALRHSAAAAREAGPVVVDEGIAAFLEGLDPDALTAEEFGELLAAAGMGGGAGLPERMAEINAMLAIARPALRERLLQEFLGFLYRPS